MRFIAEVKSLFTTNKRIIKYTSGLSPFSNLEECECHYKTHGIAKQLFLILGLNFVLSGAVMAAQPVTSATLSSQAATPATVGSESWGTGNDLRVTGITALGKPYTLAANNSVKVTFERVDNANSTGERCRVFAERIDNTTYTPSYPVDSIGDCSMENALLEPILNRGALDVFHNVNVGTQNANNIERVDVLTQSPFLAPAASELTDIGFLATEKSGNNEFNAAVITSIDINGKPSAFGPLTYIDGTTADYGRLDPTYDFRFLENAAYPPHGLPVGYSSYSEQIGYTLLTFQDLGVIPSQTIYGISFFGKDVTAAHNLLDPTTFPQTTNEGADIHGGLGAVFITDTVSIDPVAVADSQSNVSAPSTSNPTTITAVGSNDYDLDGTINVASVDLDPASSGIQNTLTTTDGGWAVNAAGDVTFTPNAGFTGTTTSISYTINDNDGNTSNQAALTVTYPITADISVSKTLLTADPYTSGQTVTYNIVVSNSASSVEAATNISVEDLPTNLTVTSASGASSSCIITPATGFTTSVVCTIASLAASADETITIQAKVP